MLRSPISGNYHIGLAAMDAGVGWDASCQDSGRESGALSPKQSHCKQPKPLYGHGPTSTKYALWPGRGV